MEVKTYVLHTEMSELISFTLQTLGKEFLVPTVLKPAWFETWVLGQIRLHRFLTLCVGGSNKIQLQQSASIRSLCIAAHLQQSSFLCTQSTNNFLFKHRQI